MNCSCKYCNPLYVRRSYRYGYDSTKINVHEAKLDKQRSSIPSFAGSSPVMDSK